LAATVGMVGFISTLCSVVPGRLRTKYMWMGMRPHLVHMHWCLALCTYFLSRVCTAC